MKKLKFRWEIPASRMISLFFSAAIIMFLLNCKDIGSAAEKSPVEEGSEWFSSYCTMCHGDNADGKGPMADMLKVPPPDLTAIAQRRNGVFPDELIGKIIAGKEKIEGHGSGEMPVWWDTFKKSEHITDEQVLQQKIDNIVAYLKTIQQ